MKKSKAMAQRTCWILTLAGLLFISPSHYGARREMERSEKRPGAAITIRDQNGRPVANARPSAISQTFDVAVGPGGTRVFSPATLNIAVGDTVRWTWSSSLHSVTSGNGASCAFDSQFCSPNDTNCGAGVLSNAGDVYQHTFAQAGSYTYFCAAHCLNGMVGTITVAPVCTPPPLNMVSWWPGDGNAFDIQGSNNGTLINGVTFAPGMVGSAFSLNGSNQYISMGNPASLRLTGSITLDAWVNPNDFGEGELREIISKWGQNFTSCGPGTTADSFLFCLTKSGGVIRPRIFIHQSDLGEPSLVAGSTPAGVFSHVATTYNAINGFFALYVNGVEVASTTLSPLGLCTSDKDVFIGAEAVGPQRFFPGLIDEVEVFNRALMPSEIAAIYNAGSAGKCHTCTPPPSNMVAWFAGDGNARDIQGGNNGALVNGTTFATGKVGQAFSLDGVDDVIQVSNAPNLNFGPNSPITVDLWAYRTGTANVMHMIGKRVGCDPAQINYQMAFDDRNGPLMGFGGPSGQATVNRDLLLNTWTHLAGTFDGTTFRFYIDGVLVGSGSGTLGPTNTAPLEIGNSGACEQFGGLIDEVEVFNRALSATEIAAIANAGAAGKCKAPQPISAVSRKAHGGAGSFNIDLNPNGIPGVECRNSAGGAYQMIVQFASPVTASGATLLSGTGVVSGFSVSGAAATIDLTSVTNAQTLVVKLNSVSDGTLSGDVPVAMGVLVGDTNGDRFVNSGDSQQTRGRSGQTTDGTNFRSDVNADGLVNSGDSLAVRSRSGTFLP